MISKGGTFCHGENTLAYYKKAHYIKFSKARHCCNVQIFFVRVQTDPKLKKSYLAPLSCRTKCHKTLPCRISIDGIN
jgi:hypothetical protein